MWYHLCGGRVVADRPRAGAGGRCWAQSSQELPLSACLRGGCREEWKWGEGTALAEGSFWVKFGRYVFSVLRGVVCLVDLRAGRGRRGTGRVPWARRGPRDVWLGVTRSSSLRKVT